MSALERFFGVLEAYKKSLAWALGGSALLPLIASLAGLAPIWPNGIVVLTSLLNLIFVVLSFQFFERAPRKLVQRVMLGALFAGFALLIVYLVGIERFVFEIPRNAGQGERIYLGCGWSTMALEVSGRFGIDPASSCPGNFRDILASAEYESDRIWTASSISTVRVGLAITWLAFFASISLFLAVFIVFQSGRR